MNGLLAWACLAAMLLAGCAGSQDYSQRPEFSPRIAAIRISQTGASPAAVGVQGTLDYCFNITNPNTRDIYEVSWIEFYIVAADESLHFVDKHGESFAIRMGPYLDYTAWDSYRQINASETGAYGSARYTLRLVTEAIIPDDGNHLSSKRASFDPPSFDERWINVTFTPYQTKLLFKEGGPCGLGRY